MSGLFSNFSSALDLYFTRYIPHGAVNALQQGQLSASHELSSSLQREFKDREMEVDPVGKIETIAELEDVSAGHDDRAWCVAWNPAKPLLASCSADKTVRLYNYSHSSSADGASDVITFSHNTTIPTGHAKTVRALAWSPSGETLATASFDSNIGIWSQEEGGDDDDTSTKEWECMSLLEGHETECKSVAYSSNGTLLASCSRDKTVWIWEVHPDSDFECMAVLMEHTQDVKCVAWHPTEEILASASYDDTIKLYMDDPSDDWFCASTLNGHTSTVWTLAWEPVAGRYLASGSDDSTIRIWRRVPSTGEIKFDCAAVLDGHSGTVYSISWTPSPIDPVEHDGTRELGWLASAGADGTILIRQISETASSSTDNKPIVNWRLVARIEAAHGVSEINHIAWCPRVGMRNVFATAGDDGHIKVWRLTVRTLENNVFLDVWLYKPEGPGPFPVVVAGHGMSLVKDAGMAVFGERWASEAGWASLILDYRGFGDSDGKPRNFISIEKQIQDYRAVIEWARARPETFRTDKIVPFGSAMAGLCVCDLIVNDPDLAGGIGHSPVLDGYGTVMGLAPDPVLLFWAAIDFVRGKLGWSPIFVKAVGFIQMYDNGTVGIPYSKANNLVAPRLAFDLMSWRPALKDAKSPMLVVAGDNDDLIPYAVTEKAVRESNGKVRWEKYSGGHFDIMEGGKAFEFNVKHQVAFLRSLM
ncbi:hypothetical protein NM688_g1331 [Phlebia brevispora]|uniref:Uncharacterized protein n=1 Tax=Phlebia brevispora TaxID=194682 RepID=A0ACC1TBU8_9APHY|nr:hypothetical protein NM688_g1331 [Phlebia brevispora]